MGIHTFPEGRNVEGWGLVLKGLGCFRTTATHMLTITATFLWRTTTKLPTYNQEWNYNHGTQLFSLLVG